MHLVVHREPLNGWHPFHAKFDWMADLADEGFDEVAWIDDDVVVRADATWPDYENFGLHAVRDCGGPPWKARGKGVRMASDLFDLGWTRAHGYYNTGIVFWRRGHVGDLREIGELSREIPIEGGLCPEQAAVSAMASHLKGFTRLTRDWHWRWPHPDASGMLPGLLNHFIGVGAKARVHELGVGWRLTPS